MYGCMVATLRQPSESPTQSESWTTPVAGMASPRFSWAADMVLALDALDPSDFHHGNHPQSWCYGQGNHIFLAPKMQTFLKSCSEYTLLKLRAGLLYYFNFAPCSNWTFLCWGSVGANWQVPDLKEANGYDTFFSVGKRVPFVHSMWVCLKMGILAGKVTNHQNFRCPVFKINQFPKCFFSLSCDC